MPVNRKYDFDRLVPDVPPYYESAHEFTRVLADITQWRRNPRYVIGGPTGGGKTHLAKRVAQDLDWYRAEDPSDPDNVVVYFDYELDTEELEEGDVCPVTGGEIEARTGVPCITIQCKYSLSEADLLGMPNFNGETTYWQDGPATKAVLASQKSPVVLLLDEFNRARPESKSALFSLLDDRCEVTLDGRGGEVITGIAKNLISIATINEGRGYYVEDMDKAERRRIGNKFDVTYLGVNHPDSEIDLLTTRTGIYEGLAETMVETANKVRVELAEKDSSSVRAGVPTGMVIAWAETARAYSAAGIDNPVMESANDAIIRPFYGNEAGEAEVRQTFMSAVDDLPFDEEAFREMQEGENQSSGDRPDNSSIRDMDENASEHEYVAFLQGGGDPQQLIDAGVDPNMVMTAMAKSRST